MTPKQLRNRRRKFGISARFIATKLGIDPARLCEMEMGRREMSEAQASAYQFNLPCDDKLRKEQA